MLELRKTCGSTTHPRLSVLQQDASVCSAVVEPLVALACTTGEPQRYQADRVRAQAKLVPVLSLGRRVGMEVATPISSSSDEPELTLTPVQQRNMGGGRRLQSLVLTPDMFDEDAMVSEPGVGLLQLKVAQLSAELEARGAAKSGLKGALQQRLRELVIADKLREREADMELDGGLSDSSDS